ncbi:MAG TPA: hypothetical protein VGB43_04905 [Flavobacterium sp.]|jgi:threonine/homoserine/homoserine lactone efflux protein
MKPLKNISVGFLVSFVGSLPMGYLNIIGFQVYQDKGIDAVITYLAGVITIEIFVIYLTLIFASKLSENKRLLKYIELFSIFFMLLLAWIFYSQVNRGDENPDYLAKYPEYRPYLLGITLNCLNFIQLPFWIGWNLYLLNQRYISNKKNLQLFYVAGTAVGTFAGMLAFILSLNAVLKNTHSFGSYIFSYVIPLLFVGFALFQAIKYYRKYYSVKATN